MKKLFHDQFDHEKPYNFFRKHWVILLPAFARIIFSIFTIVLFIYIAHYFINELSLSKNIFNFLMLFVFFFSIFELDIFFLRILSWFLSIVIITDHRVIEVVKKVFTYNEKEGVDIKKIQDVQMRKDGLIRNLLGFGRIYLTLASITDTKELQQVPNVAYWVKVLNHVRQDSILKARDDRNKSVQDRKIDEIGRATEEKVEKFI